jgi:polyhydroxybutyrate depolymerase
MKLSYRVVPCCLLVSALLAPAAAQTQQIQVQGRKVLVHVPAGYDPARPAPLVLAFHGGGGSADFMADDSRYGLQRQADQSGFIVAFPNGASRLPGGRLATWNAGACCGYARDRNSDDVGFARAVAGALEARYAIDTDRVFATGMSNGGMLVHRLACEAADVFRAVASVAGPDATTRCNPARPVSVLHIHARDDDHVLFDGGAGPGAFRDRHSVMDFVSVPQTIAGWVRRDQCGASPQRMLQVPGAYCDVYPGCAGGAQVQLCVTDTGGHSWPGADRVRPGKEAASTALDASAVIWRFFASQTPHPR